MNEDKNQRLAREITSFCEECLKPPAAKSKKVKPLLRTALVSFLTITFMSGGVGSDRHTLWVA